MGIFNATGNATGTFLMVRLRLGISQILKWYNDQYRQHFVMAATMANKLIFCEPQIGYQNAV